MKLVWVVIPLALIGIVGLQESFTESKTVYPESKKYEEFYEENTKKIVEQTYSSPLKQVRVYGILNPYEIICKHDLELIVKKSNNSPACVTPETAKKLIERGWSVTVFGTLSEQMKKSLSEKEKQINKTSQSMNLPLSIPANLDKYSAANYVCEYNSITESKNSSTEQTIIYCDAVRSKKLDSTNHLVWCTCGGASISSGLIAELYMPENCWTVNSSSIEKQGFDICKANFSDPKYLPNSSFEGLIETPSRDIYNKSPTKIMIEKQTGIQVFFETISKDIPLITESNNSEMYPFQIYEFNIKEVPNDIRHIEVRYKQWVSATTDNPSGADLYIWNAKNNEWVFVDSGKVGGAHITFTKSFTNVDELLDENNILRLLALSPWGSTRIVTDGVLVTIK